MAEVFGSDHIAMTALNNAVEDIFSLINNRPDNVNISLVKNIYFLQVRLVTSKKKVCSFKIKKKLNYFKKYSLR